MTTDKLQTKNINLLIGMVSALGGVALFMGYLHTKKHSKLQEEVLAIDKEIKRLELEEKRNGKKNSI
jgi:hypothetical protein